MRIESWLIDSALPLWAGAGFEDRAGTFHERLDLNGAPIIDVPRRLMVQARQISVYAAASISGRYSDGAQLALRAADKMIGAYFEGDGAPGWLFSVSPDGRPADHKRDLYAHAFVLFALAWIIRLDNAQRHRNVLDKTLIFLDRALADPLNGGYRDCLPRADGIRRQNPHMHLFEALIALHETTRRDDILRRAQALRALAVKRFLNPATGALCEYFDDEWNIYPAPGRGSVEPGHLFEWAWLLRQYERASDEPQDGPVAALLSMGMRFGLSDASGRIVDEISEQGVVRARSSRCWPHTEALKALCEEAIRGERKYHAPLLRIAERLLGHYCLPDLSGGWIDQLDDADRPISKFTPASTLYHLYFAFDNAIKLFYLDKNLHAR
ncbi:AGE family epimerase/isomerase [uncultured Rhodoblastus sp.]|uniref:AGE family epimerase/isomerase n=1 Tax=uncultured Rhodoblastus sp. TaxID=543037 RepID=UPI0025F90A16|nr:AGE family epimerase/isomerase [uncultured Rhodoblastus sp.]